MEHFKEVKSRFDSELRGHHLRELLNDTERNALLFREFDGFALDLTRQKLDKRSLEELQEIFTKVVWPKVQAMKAGKEINSTEKRSVLHFLLRETEREQVAEGLRDFFDESRATLARVLKFAKQVRSGEVVAPDGKRFTDVVSIGIGGSYLGVECVSEALALLPRKECKSEQKEDCKGEEKDLKLHFLSNVDPACAAGLAARLDLHHTLVVVVSKTFTTAETLQNARLFRSFIEAAYAGEEASAQAAKHFAAVSAAVDLAGAIGIPAERVFPLWDAIGGRYSVSSAVGCLPLALAFGACAVEEFLEGMASIDKLFFSKEKIEENPAALLGLLDAQLNFAQGHAVQALIPYAQGLSRLAAHVQQVAMESLGKKARLTPGETSLVGKFLFGEPGTNSQHSFFQLLHQGRACPVEFLAFTKCAWTLPAQNKPPYAEFLANVFAQIDALALGAANEDPHRNFEGDRPSTLLLFQGALTPKAIGSIIALYEHRVATEGFASEINPFDQFGVELGKKLAKTYVNSLAPSNPLTPPPQTCKLAVDFFNKHA